MSGEALNRRQAAPPQWYDACHAYQKQADLRRTAKAIDEELHWRFHSLPDSLTWTPP